MRLVIPCALAAVTIVFLLGACAPSTPAPAPAAASKPSSSTSAAAGGAPATAAPTAASPTIAAPPPPATVRMGVLGITAEAGAYIAAERGYFAAEGITPEFVTVDFGARAIPALATAQVEVLGGGFSPSLINAMQRGLNLKLVASLQSGQPERSAGGFLVRKARIDDGSIRDWADLRGRRVALPGRGTVGDYSIARGLALGGLTLADVELVELPFPDMIPAFANGNIDGAHTAEPLTTLASERGIAVRWRTSGEYAPGTVSALVTYGPTFLEQQPDVGRRWMIGYLRGARDYRAYVDRGEGRDEIVQILVKHTTVKDAALYDRMGKGYVDPDGAIDMADIAAQTAFYTQEGFVQGPADVPAMEDRSFREAALARLGPYQR